MSCENWCNSHVHTLLKRQWIAYFFLRVSWGDLGQTMTKRIQLGIGADCYLVYVSVAAEL